MSVYTIQLLPGHCCFSDKMQAKYANSAFLPPVSFGDPTQKYFGTDLFLTTADSGIFLAS